jgi:Amt family ammonium transporter
MSSWCTADDTSALSASGLAQSAIDVLCKGNAGNGRSLLASVDEATFTTAIDGITSSQDISYMLLSGFFVFFMQAGFAMLCAGSVRSKNVMNILIKNVLDACIGCMAYFCFGYAISYGTKDSNSFSGEFAGEGFFFLAKGDHDEAFSSWHVFFFQWAFTAAAATITSGAMAERTAFQAYIAYSIILSGFVYPVVVHWIWDTAGWLCNWKTDKDGESDLFNGVGMHDFAGSGVVHMTGGIAGLMGAAIVGPRTGRFDASGRPMAMPGHNAALVVLGTFILWVGWYGFNPGSVLMIHGDNAVTVARVAVTTTLAAASGGIGSMILNYSLYKVWDLVAVCNGCLAGLVSITAGAYVLQPWAAILAGLVGSVVLWASSKLLLKLKIDDPLEAFPVHGACGAWGVMAVGLFADQGLIGSYMGAETKADQKIYGALLGGGGKLLGNQILGIVIITLWVGTTIGGLFFALKTAGMLRASAEEEAAGLDESKHGGSAYNMEPSKA